MAPIRTFSIIALVMAVVIYASINFIGQFSHDNNIGVSPYLQAQYNTLNGNYVNSNSALLQNITALTNTGKSTATTLQNPNIGSGIFSAITTGSQFLLSLPGLVTSEMNIMALGLSAFGIPYLLALAVVYGIFILIIAIAILSAWFIFPI